MCTQRRLRSDWASDLPSLIRVFIVHMKKFVFFATYWPHSEDWSDWVDAQLFCFRWVHRSFCRVCHMLAHVVLSRSASSRHFYRVPKTCFHREIRKIFTWRLVLSGANIKAFTLGQTDLNRQNTGSDQGLTCLLLIQHISEQINR